MAATREVRIRIKPLGRGVAQGERAASFVGFGHWAIEIVGANSRDGNMLVGLNAAVGIASFADTDFGGEFPLYFPPGDVPDELRLDFAGSTSLDNNSITEKANEIIRSQPIYGMIGENCHRFAIILACKIITAPTERLKQRLRDELGEKILARAFPAYVVWKGVRDAWDGANRWVRGWFP